MTHFNQLECPEIYHGLKYMYSQGFLIFYSSIRVEVGLAAQLTLCVNTKFEWMIAKAPGPRLNIKAVFHRYIDSHVKDKTVARPSYL